MNLQPEFETSKKQPVLWASCIRIIATALIFLFHFQGLHGLSWNYHLDKYGIFLFLFISGYFSYQPRTSPNKWLLRRIKQIMIPYWSVMAVVLILNYLYGYKQTTFAKNLIVFFGGSFFIHNPVYVISWFITYILILYFSVYVFRSIKVRAAKTVFLGLLFWAFYLFDFGNKTYLPGFFLGYFLRWFTIRYPRIADRKTVFQKRVSAALYGVQNYCYSFFLIHPGVLLFTVKTLRINKNLSFITAILLTTICSYYHKKISDIIVDKISFRKVSFVLPT